MGTVARQQAQTPLMLTLDVGSSSLRASLYDWNGNVVEGLECRSGYQLDVTPDGGVEKDPDELFEITCKAIDNLLESAGELAGQIGGVAFDTFWHSLMGVDAQHRPTTPLFTWADTRSAPTARQLARETDEKALHARTGCKLHPTYPLAKLRWLSGVMPVIFRRTALWLSFGEYFYLRLFGQTVCTISMASGTGLFDQNKRTWDAEAVELAHISDQKLAPLGDINTPLQNLRLEFASRWQTLASVPWFGAIGDGAAGNLGSGCYAPDRIAVMVGTSGAMRVVVNAQEVQTPAGLWCYHADYDRFVAGGALSEGGNFFAWTRNLFKLPSIEESERELAKLEPDGHGLTVLPFLTGERAPGWNADARAALTGLSLDTTPLEILRAGMESIAFRFGILHGLLKPYLPDKCQIIASGGALLNSPVWMQILADVLNHPVIASGEGETTSRGAALLALEQLGAFGGRQGANKEETVKGDLSRAAFRFGDTFEPSLATHNRYVAAMERQRVLYEKLLGEGK
jgi:gluconokinase